MSESALTALAGIVLLGVGAQWLAARLGLPSILLLLVVGFFAGPVTGFLHPDELFEELLFPLVSLSVALILYEGGLTLKLSDLPRVGGVVRNLVSFGAIATWLIAAVAARLIFGLDVRLAVLLGAILVVTGPTVIGPLLRHIRPQGNVGSVLMWEGIVIDPIGAVLAVLVFEVIGHGEAAFDSAQLVVLAIAKTLVFGGGLGILGGVVLAQLIKRYLIPDFLQNAVSFMFVLGAFLGANLLQHEAGLLAVTVMGIYLANQKQADVRHIVEFKENLRVLLISSLFVILAARLQPAALTNVMWRGLLFVAVLVLIARPLSVWISTIGSKFTRAERLFIMWLAPRGIVAAAIASLFALRLEHAGYADAGQLVPITFIVIIGTVAIYGLTSPLVARCLGVASVNPQGVLFVGAQPWVRAAAAMLKDKGFRVLLVDTNRQNVTAARMANLDTYSGSVLAEYAIEEMRLGGIGRLLAVTQNDWVNALASQRFTPVLGRQNCYQIRPYEDKQGKESEHKHLHGRWLFGENVSTLDLARRHAVGAVVKATPLTEEFDFAAYRSMHGDRAIPLFAITENKKLIVLSEDDETTLAPGHTVISLVTEPKPEKK